MTRIEDYAYISDNQTGALVSKTGSIDWFCIPRFDSPSCFASLVGHDDNGRWLLGPVDKQAQVKRCYRPGTLILESEFTTATGCAKVIDFMPQRQHHPTIVRLVVGLRGTVEMRMDLRLRFDYGWVVPWVRRIDGGIMAVAGPEAVVLRTPIGLHGHDMRTDASFRVGAGDRLPFVLQSFDSSEELPDPVEAELTLNRTEYAWREWSDQCEIEGDYATEIKQSLAVLKGLIYKPTGGVVAAPTTSLPEQIGGSRNWDYRYCWLRDASMTMGALVAAGYLDEAKAWRDWLLRAVAGDPKQLQILYGVDGFRRLTEQQIPWLKGYEHSSPVRIGNGAVDQFQLDVPGEVMDATALARKAGLPPEPHAWSVQRKILQHVEDSWIQPDEGIWEVRGGAQHFVYSKVMAWVAADRAARGIHEYGLKGDAGKWEALADQIHLDVMTHGFDEELNSFVQSYGSKVVDASLLQIPLVGFLPGDHPRVVGTIDAVEQHLEHDGFVDRYSTAVGADDGLKGTEGSFLICSFWLIQALAAAGRNERARELLGKILAIRNDVGLFSEEYDVKNKRMLGNFPQAFSHIGLVNAALACRNEHPLPVLPPKIADDEAEDDPSADDPAGP